MDNCTASTPYALICLCDLCAQNGDLSQLQNDDVDMDSSVNLDDYPESFASNSSCPPPSLSMSTGVTSDCSWPSEAQQSFNEQISSMFADPDPLPTWPDSAGMQTRISGPEDTYIYPQLPSLGPTSSDTWHASGYRDRKDSSHIAGDDTLVQKTNEHTLCPPFQVLPEQHATNDFDHVFNDLQATTPDIERDVSWLVNWATRYPNTYPKMEKLKSLEYLSGMSEADIVAWLREHFDNQTNSKIDLMVTDTEQPPRSQRAPRYQPKCLKSRRRFRHVPETPRATKIFECTRRCGESFKKKGDWKRHELYNIEEWRCHICDFAPSRKDKLPKHLQECHGYYGPLKKSHCRQLLHANARPCGFCGMQLPDWSTWLNHVAAHFEGHIPGGPWTMARWSRDIAQDLGWGENDDDDDDDDDGDGDDGDNQDNHDNHEDEGGHDSSDNGAKRPDDQSTKGKGASSGGGAKGSSRASRSSKSQSTGSHTSKSNAAGIETPVAEMSTSLSPTWGDEQRGQTPGSVLSASVASPISNAHECWQKEMLAIICRYHQDHIQDLERSGEGPYQTLRWALKMAALHHIMDRLLVVPEDEEEAFCRQLRQCKTIDRTKWICPRLSNKIIKNMLLKVLYYATKRVFGDLLKMLRAKGHEDTEWDRAFCIVILCLFVVAKTQATLVQRVEVGRQNGDGSYLLNPKSIWCGGERGFGEIEFTKEIASLQKSQDHASTADEFADYALVLGGSPNLVANATQTADLGGKLSLKRSASSVDHSGDRRKVLLSEGAAFHAPSSPPTENEVALTIHHLPRLSPTWSFSPLVRSILEKEDITTNLFVDFDEAYADARGKLLGGYRRGFGDTVDIGRSEAPVHNLPAKRNYYTTHPVPSPSMAKRWQQTDRTRHVRRYYLDNGDDILRSPEIKTSEPTDFRETHSGRKELNPNYEERNDVLPIFRREGVFRTAERIARRPHPMGESSRPQNRGDAPAMTSAATVLKHENYTVGWICALASEMAAAETILDQRHASLQVKEHDSNTYQLGSIGSQNVVIPCLPSGFTGTTSAATVAESARKNQSTQKPNSRRSDKRHQIRGQSDWDYHYSRRMAVVRESLAYRGCTPIIACNYSCSGKGVLSPGISDQDIQAHARIYPTEQAFSTTAQLKIGPRPGQPVDDVQRPAEVAGQRDSCLPYYCGKGNCTLPMWSVDNARCDYRRDGVNWELSHQTPGWTMKPTHLSHILCHPFIVTHTGLGGCAQKGHWSSVYAVVLSPDGKLLASSSDDRTVKLWDAATGASLQTVEGYPRSVEVVAFSPDSKLLASASHDCTVRLQDTATGVSLQTLEGHSSSINAVAFSPDDNQSVRPYVLFGQYEYSAAKASVNAPIGVGVRRSLLLSHTGHHAYKNLGTANFGSSGFANMQHLPEGKVSSGVCHESTACSLHTACASARRGDLHAANSDGGAHHKGILNAIYATRGNHGKRTSGVEGYGNGKSHYGDDALVVCDVGGGTVDLTPNTLPRGGLHEAKSSFPTIGARENASKNCVAALQPRTASFDTIRKLYGVKDRARLARFKMERFLNEPDDDRWEAFREKSMETDALEDNLCVFGEPNMEVSASDNRLPSDDDSYHVAGIVSSLIPGTSTRVFECANRCDQSFDRKGRHERPNVEEWKCQVRPLLSPRKERLQRHLKEKKHGANGVMEGHCRALLDASARPCGFCLMRFDTWPVWLNHVSAHFEGRIPGGPWTMTRWNRTVDLDFDTSSSEGDGDDDGDDDDDGMDEG